MDQLTQWCQAAAIFGGYLLSVYFQNRRIDDLKDSINKRFDDLCDLLKSEVRRVEERIGHLESPVIRQK